MQKPHRNWDRRDRVPARELTSIDGASVPIPGDAPWVHLQFRRFAGCPVCDLHLRSIVRRHAELTTAGVREVVVFHSSAEELRKHGAHELPLPVIADSGRALYREFGVESAPRALADPRAWWPIVRAVAATVWLTLRGRRAVRFPIAEGGRLGLPADFLIDREGRVVAWKYGEHVYDQWSADEILQHAGAGGRSRVTHGASAPSASR